MSRQDQNLEIPGFSRDPNTGKYYRIPTAGVPSTIRLNINSSIKRDPPPVEESKYKNIVTCLEQRETGTLWGSLYEHHATLLKTQKFKEKFSFFQRSDMRMPSIRFLKGGNNNLNGMWFCEKRLFSHFVTFEDLTNIESLNPLIGCYTEIFRFTQPISVADLCEGFSSSSILFVGNDWNLGQGSAYLIQPEDFGEESSMTFDDVAEGSPIWCCSSNRATNTFAFGIERGVQIYRDENHLSTHRLKGQVHAVSFNETGNLVYAGLNSGKLIIVDVRAENHVMEKKLSRYCLTETLPFANDNCLICAGANNLLCRIDLRKQVNGEVLSDFKGEVRSNVKIALSINETRNVLCSTGTDNVTRLWSLNGGKPIQIIEPPMQGPNCRSWLVANSRKCSVYIVQLGEFYGYQCI